MPDTATSNKREPAAAGAVTQDEAAAMLRAAFNLFRLWQVNDAQARVLLGQPIAPRFQR